MPDAPVEATAAALAGAAFGAAGQRCMVRPVDKTAGEHSSYDLAHCSLRVLAQASELPVHCMAQALSVVVFVGDCKDVQDALAARARALTVGCEPILLAPRPPFHQSLSNQRTVVVSCGMTLPCARPRRHRRCGFDAAVDVGPMISPKAKERAEALVASGIAAGAQCLLDGRGVKVVGYEKGNFLGPTLLAVRARATTTGTRRT